MQTPKQAELELTGELGFSFRGQNGQLTVVILEPELHVTTLTQTDGRWDACYLLDKAWRKLVEQKIAIARLTADYAEVWQRPDVLEA